MTDETADPTEAELRAQHGGWFDSNPFYLLIALDDQRFVEIDLGERGWIAKYGEQGFLRDPGKWCLVQKQTGLVLAMIRVNEGEQPYYVRRHVGFAGAGGQTEIAATGIGKKRTDGHVDRIWILPNGVVLTGDDLEPLALEMLRSGQI